MNTANLALAACGLLVLIILAVFIFRPKKQVTPKRQNRRSAFRLSLWEHECTFTAAASPEPVYDGWIRDISVTGIKLISYEDLTKIEEITVNFELEEYFSLPGKIERRKRLENGLYEFGVHFTYIDQKTEQKLFKILWDKSKEKVVL